MHYQVAPIGSRLQSFPAQPRFELMSEEIGINMPINLIVIIAVCISRFVHSKNAMFDRDPMEPASISTK